MSLLEFPLVFLSALALSLVVSLVLTPLVRRYALRWNWTDEPDGGRKLHARPIPNVGGVAIAAAFVVTVDALRLYDLFGPAEVELSRLFPDPRVVLGAGLIAAVGLLDDLLNLHHRTKFAAQVAVTALVFASGSRIMLLDGLLGEGPLGLAVSGVLTLVWMVGVMNAINLIDGMDGLAAGVTALAFVGMAGAYALNGDMDGLLLPVAVVGALLGFLRYNFHPASIFMGDSGSLFLGFLLAVYGLRGTAGSDPVLLLVIPAVAMGLPVLDTLISMVRRRLDRRPLFHPDRDHIHHRLARLLSHRGAVLVLYGVGAFFAAGAMGMAAVTAPVAALVFGAGALIVLSFVWLLGYLGVWEDLRPSWSRPRWPGLDVEELPISPDVPPPALDDEAGEPAAPAEPQAEGLRPAVAPEG